jgi:hypothetical protein
MTRISDEAVEAAAQALFIDQQGDFVQPAKPWLTTFEGAVRPKFARRARVALEAALPHLTDDGAGSGEPAVAAGEAGSIPAGNPFRGVYEAAASLQTAEDIATVIEEYADDLEPPTTSEWLEQRSWFKGLLHEVAARAREIGGAS